MSRRRPYKAVSVNQLDAQSIVSDALGMAAGTIHVGIDISKRDCVVVFRFGDRRFSQPVRVLQPEELNAFIGLLSTVHERVTITVGLESTGTYGDALRYALHKAGFAVFRVSGKAVGDYEEIFDGVPSKHDGKDAAIIAELLAFGKATQWKWRPDDANDQLMKQAVDRLDMNSKIEAMWLGQLEAKLARHWPEVATELELKSATLVRMLLHYGGPEGMAADDDAASRLRGWGRGRLVMKKIERIVASAKNSIGVPMTAIDLQSMHEICSEILQVRAIKKACRKTLRELSAKNETLQRMAKAVGEPTACVLWVSLGSPRNYPCAGAYLKAAGLNLKVRSSGKQKGQLRITRRGPSRVRHWMYFAALRAVQQPPVTRWFEQHKARGGTAGPMKATIGVMRKLLRAVWHTSVTDDEFQWGLLFPGRPISPDMQRRHQAAAAIE